MKILSTVCCLTALLLVTACGGSEKADASATPQAPALVSTAEVKSIFEHYVSGDYAGYVGCMQSCDDKPAEYKQQMAMLFKQHAADQRHDDGDVKDFRVVRVQPQADGYAAEAFVSVDYTGGKTEEILLQLVYTNGEWRLR